MRTKWLLFAWVLILGGCATILHTPYAPFGKSSLGGYEERQLGAARFAVNFRANGHTPAEKIYDFTLLRASEIAMREGRKLVIITEWKKGPYTTNGPVHEVYTSTGMMTGSAVLTFVRSEMFFDVADVANGAADKQSTYVAQDEIKELRAKYGLPPQ